MTWLCTSLGDIAHDYAAGTAACGAHVDGADRWTPQEHAGRVPLCEVCKEALKNARRKGGLIVPRSTH
jgi:hypothetical protein